MVMIIFAKAAEPATNLSVFALKVLEAALGGAVCEIESKLAVGILDLINDVGAGVSADITALPAQLTTGQITDLLHVSRPTVVALIDKGLLDSTRLGTHRRVGTVDVLSYREQSRHERRQALGELVQVSEELGLYKNSY